MTTLVIIYSMKGREEKQLTYGLRIYMYKETCGNYQIAEKEHQSFEVI